ncbi:hypothetical protein DIE08_35045 [Burkholderia sp. Bp9004]|nr:hypothetical protein DIE08_35045 [Burkholderia sp. Bp9004]
MATTSAYLHGERGETRAPNRIARAFPAPLGIRFLRKTDEGKTVATTEAVAGSAYIQSRTHLFGFDAAGQVGT